MGKMTSSVIWEKYFELNDVGLNQEIKIDKSLSHE